jgi:hypothetical protein
MEIINLETLAKGCPGLTPSKGTAMAEAASVCLIKNDHPVTVDMSLSNLYSGKALLTRLDVDEQMSRSHADEQRAVEDGAYGVAILIMRYYEGLTVLRQSPRKTGVDWWLGREPEDDTLIFNDCARLEVSGILRGDDTNVRSRVKSKMEQSKRSDGLLPAYIVVVEFSKPESRTAKR